MAVVIHTIKGGQYAYNHHREGKKVVSDYMYPVDGSGHQRPIKEQPPVTQQKETKSESTNTKTIDGRTMFAPTEKQEKKWTFSKRKMPTDDEFKQTWAKKHGGKTKGWGIGKRDWAKTNLASDRDYQVGMWQGRVDAANKMDYHSERKTKPYNYGYYVGHDEYSSFRRGYDKKSSAEFDNKYVKK